jgi:large subunit ribosomal protein L19
LTKKAFCSIVWTLQIDIDVGKPIPTSHLIYIHMDKTAIRYNLKPGMIVKVHQKIKELDTKGQEKERIQIFEGTVIAMKHGSEAGATFTVRKVTDGIGVERIYPLYSPVVADVEVLRQLKVHQAKPLYLRTTKKKLKEVKRDRTSK